jgi:hypothetical protein
LDSFVDVTEHGTVRVISWESEAEYGVHIDYGGGTGDHTLWGRMMKHDGSNSPYGRVGCRAFRPLLQILINWQPNVMRIGKGR